MEVDQTGGLDPTHVELRVEITISKVGCTKKVDVYRGGGATSDVLAEAIEAALAELKGKP